MTIRESITSGQSKQIVRFGADAVEAVLTELDPSKDGAQCVIEEHGDEFAEAMRNAARVALKAMSVPNQFADEEVDSNFTYPPEYKGVKGIAEQTNILRGFFPGLGFADEKVTALPLPKHAEGWFAIPRWQNIAPTYGEAVEKVLALIKSGRKFYNYRQGKLAAKYLRQHAKTEKMLRQVGDQQKDFDVLVVAAQFGLRFCGKSVRRGRVLFEKNEFGLGAFAIGIMLLTHPERLVRWEQLHVDCAGDEYSPEADDEFVSAPIFVFHDGEVEFGTGRCGNAGARVGSASAFLAQ
ncbi:hypothetical protein HY224_01640 [Candidatus Uhrbacteria bacterium]|nr:hypothetical protein [Candidatus Uhrbacteria bacterium]